MQHQWNEEQEWHDGRFAQVSQEKNEHRNGYKIEPVLFCILKEKPEASQSADEGQNLIPVFKAGHNLCVKRMRHKHQGDEEREKDIVIMQQPFQDKKQQHRQCPVEKDVDGVAPARFITPELKFNGKGGFYDWPVIGGR
jgi:hypothetical protein